MKKRPLFLSSILTGLALASCAPNQQVPLPHPSPAPQLQGPVTSVPEPHALHVVATPVPLTLPVGPSHPLKAQHFSTSGIDFSIVSFDCRDCELVVDDQPGGPGSEYDRAEEAGRGNLAAINAGFFTPEGAPLGLVITKGRRRGSINRASYLGTGFFLGPKAQLINRTEFLNSNPKPTELLQSGPRLLWSGETLTGLSDKDQRPRSFLLWDGRNHFAMGYANPASLKRLSDALKSQPIAEFKIAYALNLDGGRSSDFWVSPTVTNGGFTRTSFFNKDVRNYLVLRRSQ